MRVLDLGCGAGRNVIFLAELGHDITAIDFAESVLGQLEIKIQERKRDVSVSFRHHDTTQPLPFDTDSSDAVVDITTSTAIQPASTARANTSLSSS